MCARYCVGFSKGLRNTASGQEPSWNLFWVLYLMSTADIPAFIGDYCAAWKLQPGVDQEIIVFVDNGDRIAIPFPATVDDRELIMRLRTFYSLVRMKRGLTELFGARSSERIDIVKVFRSCLDRRYIRVQTNACFHSSRRIHRSWAPAWNH
jgi:hypothetical protein